MNTGIITLSFSETVNISTFMPTELTLIDSAISPVTMYTLQNPGMLLTDDDSPIVSFQLNTEDLNAIKLDTLLFATLGSSHLTITSDTVIDMSNNVIVSLDDITAVRAGEYVTDSGSPELLAYELDLNTSAISLTFDEAVNLMDFNPTVITLLNRDINATISYQIQGIRDSENIGDFGLTVSFSLTSEDLNELKAYEDFATEPNNTFLIVTDELITDTSRLANKNTPITAEQPLMASVVHPDLILPQLVEFVLLDFNEGTLQLRFDEPVNASSVQFDMITIFADSDSPINRTLQGGTAMYVTDILRRVIEIQLSDDDIFEIKLTANLATDRTNSYVQIEAGAILDQGGNAVLPSSTIQVSAYIEDTTGPRAEGFALDMDEGILVVTFDDILDVETLDIGGIAIQRDINGAFIGDRVELTSQVDSVTNSSNGFEILIFIPFEDLNALKVNLDLASDINNTYLTLTAETIEDVNGNDAIPFVREMALQPFGYIPDTTSPELVSFNLDIDGPGSLTLSFSEAVNQEELLTSDITLIGDNNESFIVTSTNFPKVPPQSSFRIVLGEEDLNVIKTLPDLATLESNIYLAITSLAVKDTSGNNVTAIEIESPLNVTLYLPDRTQPELRSFELDMNTGMLYLSFVETVNGSSFDPAGITIRGGQGFTDPDYTLTGGEWEEFFRNDLLLNLTIVDLNEIKRLIGLADQFDTTYIALTSATVRDMNSNDQSNPIIELQLFEAILTTNYEFDVTAPILMGFSLNLTSETLELTFDETVNAFSLRIDSIVIQSEILVNESIDIFISGDTSSSGFPASGSGELAEEEDTFMVTSLTVGSENSSYSTSLDSTVIIINLGSDDLNDLKRQTGLATDTNNTYISFPYETIRDMNRNLVVPVTQSEAQQADSFYPDLIPPELVRFDLNLTSEILSLTFSEVVNASSVDVTQLTLQGAFDSSDSRTLTVGVNGSVVSQVDDTEIEIALGPDDLNEIKRLTNLATMRSTAYLTLTMNAVRDMNSNAVVSRTSGVNALQVALYTEDLIPPQLAAFNIDIDMATLTLELTETVDASTLNVTHITLQSDKYGIPGQNFTLTSSSQSFSSDNTTIIIELSRDDLNALKFLTDLAQDRQSTYISLTDLTIQDMNGNLIIAVPTDSAIQVSTYLADETGPVLQSFELDLDSEILTLHYDETVNVSSVQYMRFIVQSSLPPETNYTLSAGSVLGINSPDVEIKLDFHDLNQIKLDPELATNISNTYLTMREGGIIDLALEPKRAFLAELQASTFTEDVTRPQLLQFSANLNLGTITLNFDEPVNVSSLATPGITLLNDRAGPTSLTLTGGNTTSENGLQIVINLSVDDLNEIKRLESLYVDLESSYIAIEPFTVSDMNGNPVVEISSANALNASSFVNDTTRPRLLAFDLDLNSNIMTFEFVETVNTSSINFTGITLQQSSNSSNQYTLTGGTLLELNDSTIVQFEITLQDLNTIKAQQIALVRSTTWLTIADFTILDQNMQLVIPHANGQNAQSVRDYVPDTTPPILESFNLDLTSENLVLEFSETVNVFETLNITSITLLAGANADLLNQSHTLGMDINNTFSNDIYTPTVTIQLGRLDLNEIKRIVTLATNVNDTFIAIDPMAIADMKLNAVVAIQTSVPLQVTTYTEDMMSPVLESFNLDMNTGTLTTYFSETIDPKTLDLSQFALQHTMEATNQTLMHILTGGIVDGNPNPWIAVTLTDSDLNEIKRITGLATSPEDTYLRVAAAGIQDTNGNYIVPVPNGNALMVTQFTEDRTRPELVSYDLNLSTERLVLTFSETVNSSSLDVTGIVIQNSAFSMSPNLRRLTGGNVLTLDHTEVEIQLNADDLNYIKSVPGLATSETNTYISIENYTIFDMNANPVVSIRNGRALNVSSFTEDDRDPVLISFNLDLDTGMISLTFNESVNVSSLMVEEISLQNDMLVSIDTTLFYFRSEVGTKSNSPDWPEITIIIGTDDLNEIKRLSELAISPETTYLDLTQLAIQDMNGNYLTPITLAVSNYTNDTTPPEIVEFTFDLDAGQLHFTFSETVNVSSLDVTQITLQSTQVHSNSSYNVSLTGGVLLTPNDNTTATVELLKQDVDTIKALPLATSRYNTFLSVTMDMIMDMNSNRIVAIGDDMSQMAVAFVNDTTRPELQNFSLDVNSGVLTLTFSETVDPTTLTLTEITIQDAPGANSTFHFATTWSLQSDPIVFIYFSKVDLDALKLNRQVGTNLNDTYITITNSTILDKSGNMVIGIPDGLALQVDLYIRDSTSPELEAFNLDIDSGRLTLFYSETIDIFSLDPTTITLQGASSMSDSLHSYTLTGGYVRPEDGTEAYIDITVDDLNEIKRLIYVATCTSNDTYLSLIENTTLSEDVNMGLNVSVPSNMSDNDTQLFASGESGDEMLDELTFSSHIFDMASNPVVAIRAEMSLDVNQCTEDTARPQLVSFTLNMHNGTLFLTFDETVNTSTLNLPEITFYSDTINFTEFYQLTAGSASMESLAGQTEIEIIISNTDLNEIKRREGLGNDTQISITQYLVLDMNKNRNLEISPENASTVDIFVPDERPPILLTFELDLTLERLTLSFTETVNASSLDVTEITLQNENFTSYRTLQGGYFLTPGDGGPPLGPNDPIIIIQLNKSDLNYIKSITDLATEFIDTYLSLERLAISDMNGNQVEEIPPQTPLLVSDFTPDLVAPELVSFNLDMDSGELFLMFSETVDVSTLNVMQLTLQAAESSPSQDQYSFTPGNTTYDTFSTSPDWPDILVQIGIDDLDEIKRLTQLAVSNLTTYLTLTESAIQDMNGNEVVPVENGNATQVTVFIQDTTDPQLLAFNVDMNLGLLQMTFDETVDFSTLNFTSLSLQSSETSEEISVQLTGGNITNTNDSTQIEMLFAIDNLNELKRLRPLANSSNNTYLTISRGGLLDMNGNQVVEINSTNALKVSEFMEDVTRPRLVSFDIDMDSGTLFLTFDETVEASSLKKREVVLQDNSLASNANNTYMLTGGESSMEDSTVLVINISFFDLNEIKKIRGLASDSNGSNTFIRFSNMTVSDMNGNPVVSLADGMAVQTSSFTEDTIPPELVSFNLDMNIAILTLNFSETVDTLTFNVTQFTLQSSSNISNSVQMYSLTEPNLLTGDEVIITDGILYLDLNIIKSLLYLATSAGDTYLRITELAIEDMNGNSVVAISPYDALQVSSYQNDLNRPLLESFDLDMDTGEITMTFSETVNVSSLDVTEILILNNELNATQTFRLNIGSYSNSSDWPIFVINIGSDDLNEIKRLDMLAISNDTTFFELSYNVLTDTAGNMNLPTNATQVERFTPDTTNPIVVSFNLDLSLDVVTFRFSETVRGGSLDPTQLTFVSDDSTDDSMSGSGSGSGMGLGRILLPTNYTLTGGENLPLTRDSTELQLELTFEDRNELKRLVDLATSPNNTFISITADFIEDMNANPILPISSDSALGITNYTADFIEPELERFDLDMDGPTLTLYFSETVNVSSMNVSGITLQSSKVFMDGMTQYYMLTDLPEPYGSHSTSESGHIVVIEIGESDSNVIKFLTELAQDDNSTYIAVTADTIQDMNGNSVVPVLASDAAIVTTYQADITGPVLRGFTLNLTSERLSLTFDETVDFNTTVPMLITLQNLETPTAYHRLSQAVSIGANSHILVLNLTATQNDLNGIKLLQELATSLENTYISLADGAIHDLALNSNPILSTTILADDFYPDLIPPEIVSFDVNINASTLTLVFTEVVNVSSLDPTAVRLQNGSSLNDSYVQLTGRLSVLIYS